MSPSLESPESKTFLYVRECQCVWVCPHPVSIRGQFYPAPQCSPTLSHLGHREQNSFVLFISIMSCVAMYFMSKIINSSCPRLFDFMCITCRVALALMLNNCSRNTYLLIIWALVHRQKEPRHKRIDIKNCFGFRKFWMEALCSYLRSILFLP